MQMSAKALCAANGVHSTAGCATHGCCETLADVKGKLWATFIPSSQGEAGAPPRGVSILARDFQVVTLYKADGTFAGVRRIGSGNPIEVEGMQIIIDGAIGSTGLEVKVDPGVPFVYAGFAGAPPCLAPPPRHPISRTTPAGENSSWCQLDHLSCGCVF